MDSFLKFSDRYGYTKPNSVVRRGCLVEHDLNCLCNCFDLLEEQLRQFDNDDGHAFPYSYPKMEEAIWCYFLKRRKKEFRLFVRGDSVPTEFLQSPTTIWYEVFNLIEFSLHYLTNVQQQPSAYKKIVRLFIDSLNETFLRQDFAYRIVNNQVVEISDDKEIETIEEAMTLSDNVGVHLNDALRHLSSRPQPDYRNSIKESISAVEALCRSITDESTFGDALKSLEKRGMLIPHILKKSFELLYAYTNDKTTGIRHALIDATEAPSFNEAKYMLVTCSAFINYIRSKNND